MKIQRIWLCCCLLFCIYCLSILVDEQFEVTYLADDDRNKTEDLLYLWCVSLENLPLNRTLMQLSELSETLMAYFKEGFSRNISSIFKLEEYIKEFRKLVLNRTSSVDNLVIMREMACILFNRNEIPPAVYNVFVRQDLLLVYKPDTLDWAATELYQKFDQLIVINQPYPYSNCSKSHSRYRCVNECIKRQFRLSEYFYLGNEIGQIHLNQTKNETVRSYEKSCFDKCKTNHCKIVYLSPNNVWEKNEESIFIFRAQPVISRFDFRIQLVGLVFFIIDISVWLLLDITVVCINSKLRRRTAMIATFCLKLCVLIVSLLCCSYLCTRLILDYHNKITDPSRKETTRSLPKPPETMHLVVCIPIEFIFSNYSFRNSFRKVDYETMSMLQLEQTTDLALNQTIDSITLDYQDKSQEIEWIVSEQVMFKMGVGFFAFLERCFQLIIHPDAEPLYQRLLAITKLEIKFKHNKFTLFLLTEHERSLSSESFECTGRHSFLKNIKQRSRLNGKCIDYSVTYLHLNCTTRRNCIERCAQRLFFDTYHNVTIGNYRHLSVIAKEQFSPTEWKTARPIQDDDANGKIFAKCIEQIPNNDSCVDVRFEIDSQINQLDKNSIEIELYYEVVTSVEEEPSFYKLVLDLLSIQSIFFGFTIYDLRSAGKFLKSRLVHKLTREPAKIRSLIDLACLIGLFWHISFIVDEILNAELSLSQHFEIAENLSMPAILLCVDSLSSASFVEGHRLTGNDLEELTKELSAERFFQSIAFLDDENDWIELDANTSSELLRVEPAFFQLKKCFSLEFNLTYHMNQFVLGGSDEAHNEVLRVRLNQKFFEEEKTLHFMTHRTMQFSKILRLSKFAEGVRYSIVQELFLFRQMDRFVDIKNFFRDPLSLFHDYNDPNDVNGYIVPLMQGFKETYGKVTLNLPIHKYLFDLEIDDTAFESYFAENEQDRKAPAGSNFEREYAINLMNKQNCLTEGCRNHSNPHISFSLISFKKVIVATNEDMNWAKLILSLLNVLSTWLSGRVLDIPAYAFAFRQFLRLLYQSLLNIGKLLFVQGGIDYAFYSLRRQ